MYNEIAERPSPWTVLKRIVIFLLYILWDFLAIGFMTAPLYGRINPVITAILILAALVLYFYLFRSLLKRIRKINPDFEFKWPNFRNWRKMIWIIVVWVVMNLANDLVVVVERAFWPHLLGDSTVNQQGLDLLTSSNGIYSFLLMVVVAVVLAPVAEELMFRGLFFAYFDYFKVWWIGPILSALAFGAFHLNGFSPRDLMDWPVYAVLGLGLAYVYKRSGRISNDITLHVGNNLFAMAMTGLSMLK